MTESCLIDAEERDTIRTSLDQSLLVEAAAGTGKTTQLVNRLVALIESGSARVEQMVAVTFTRKAAGELKLRLRQELEDARHRSSGSCKANLERAIASLEEARIGTIHSFCGELLRERPVEAHIDPSFQEMSQDEAPRVFGRVFKSWIEDQLDRMPDSLTRALARIGASSTSQSSPLDRLRDEAWKLVEWRDFDAPWSECPFDPITETDLVVEAVRSIAEASDRCDNDRDYLKLALEPVRLLVSAVERSESLRGERDYPELEGRLVALLRALKKEKRKGRGPFAEGISRADLLQQRQDLIDSLTDYQRRADASLAFHLRQLFEPLVAQYQQAKKLLGGVDFADLLIMTRDLLRDYEDVRRHLNRKFTHIFVDEFQDTDALQVEILLLLCSADPDQNDWRKVRVEDGKLFVVGDPKQSIYRFRRADVSLYEEVKDVLLQSGVQLLHLRTNFRSAPAIQGAVNAAFRTVFDGDRERSQPGYVELEPWQPESNPEAADGHKIPPPVVALPVPSPFGHWGGVGVMAINESLPQATAAFIDWLVNESDWTIADPENSSRRTRIRPRHITILFRRFVSWNSDVTRPYLRQLDDRRITHLLVGSRTFHQREEVESLRVALMAVEWPDDALSVFATLKGSLFSIDDGRLLEFRKKSGVLHPFRKLDPGIRDQFPEIAEVLEFLADLHVGRNRRPIVATLNRILEFGRVHAGLALRPAGEQVLANVQKACDLARTFELSGGLSFRSFVDFLISEAEKPRSVDSSVLEEGADGVRIMTLHSAKGLEAPIVILADMTAKLASSWVSQHVDQSRRLCAQQLLGCMPLELLENEELEHKRDQAEGERIAYVAATRAREMLVIPAIGSTPYESGWLSPLNPAIYPPRESWANPSPAPPGCPEFGERTTLKEPVNRDGMPLPTIRPGTHHPESGSHPVVWWDPASLKLNAFSDVGLRNEDTLIDDDTGSAAGLAVYEEWKNRRAGAIARGSQPGVEIIRPSDTDNPPAQPIAVRLETVRIEGPQPGGKRFGSLVHTILRDVELDGSPDDIRQLVDFHGRNLKATPLEHECAQRAVAAILEHPLISRARQASECLREFPITLRFGQDQLLEGLIDLTFPEDQKWTLVDFKTGGDVSTHLPEYEAQVQWYAEALRQAMDAEVEACILALEVDG